MYSSRVCVPLDTGCGSRVRRTATHNDDGARRRHPQHTRTRWTISIRTTHYIKRRFANYAIIIKVTLRAARICVLLSAERSVACCALTLLCSVCVCVATSRIEVRCAVDAVEVSFMQHKSDSRDLVGFLGLMWRLVSDAKDNDDRRHRHCAENDECVLLV